MRMERVKIVKMKHFQAVVSQFVLSTCLLRSHEGVPTCFCLTLVILEGSIDFYKSNNGPWTWCIARSFRLYLFRPFFGVILRVSNPYWPCMCSAALVKLDDNSSVIFLDFFNESRSKLCYEDWSSTDVEISRVHFRGSSTLLMRLPSATACF